MEKETERSVPAELAETWAKATADPDPLAALDASVALSRRINGWQGTLVAEAMRGGATWEQVGEALGISRQAAWARFRTTVGDEGRTKMEDEAAQVKDRIHEE